MNHSFKVFLVLTLLVTPILTQAQSLQVKAIEGVVILKNVRGIGHSLRLAESFVVEQGMKLETIKGSVTLVNPGDFGVKIYRGSILELAPPIQDAKNEKWELKLNRGAALTHVKNPKNFADHFKLKTRAVTMGVRGTTFYVRDEGKKSIFFCPCKGKIAVVNTKTSKEVKNFETTHHDEPSEFSAGTAAASASKEDPKHSDAEIDNLVLSI